MYSFNEKSISEAKQDLPGIVREAANGYETVARNFKSTRDTRVSILSTDILEEILDAGFKFHPIVEEDPEIHGWTVALPDLLLHGDGATLYEALQDLAENLMDYASDYMSRVDFFRQIENRRGHFPYLRRIIRFTEIQKVMEVIAECHTDLQQAISKQLQNG